jgi:hypothetical protein
MDANLSKLRHERDKIAIDAIQYMCNLHRKNIQWPKALTALLASTKTGENIPSELLQLALSEPFTSIKEFYPEAVERYVFVETYTGLDSDVS